MSSRGGLIGDIQKQSDLNKGWGFYAEHSAALFREDGLPSVAC